MITPEQEKAAREGYAKVVSNVKAVLRKDEIEGMLLEDFGLGEMPQIGLGIIPTANTPAINIKLLILTPWQICPQHRHKPVGDYAGKEETFRCEWGEVYVYMPGEATPNPKAQVAPHRKPHFSSWNERILKPGDQFTSPPNNWHWFQAGPEGAALWTFCSHLAEGGDEFADPGIQRRTRDVRGGTVK